MEYGYTSSHWMSKQLIAMADSTLVKHAVIQLMNEVYARGSEVSPVEIMDRLIQVSLTGDYSPPDITRVHVETAIQLADDVLDNTYLSDDDVESAIQEFRKLLGADDEDGGRDEKTGG